MAKTDVKYLNPVDVELRSQEKYCRFKKMGIKYIDYKDPDFFNAIPKRSRKDSSKKNYRQLIKISKKISCFCKKSKANCSTSLCG
jgi:small subunit ribosomal protein S18